MSAVNTTSTTSQKLRSFRSATQHKCPRYQRIDTLRLQFGAKGRAVSRGPSKALAKITIGQCDKRRIQIGISDQGID